MVFNVRIAMPQKTAPVSRNTPATVLNTNSRWVSQSATTIRMAKNTTPTHRQKNDTNAISSSDINRNRSSSKSVRRRSRRVCAIARKVAVKFFRDENKPISTLLDSLVNVCLAPTNEKADYQANTSRNANRFPWVFVNIFIRNFCSYFAFFDQ